VRGASEGWAVITTTADRLNGAFGALTLQVRAARQWSWTTLTVTEGFAVVDNLTNMFEPVRRRRLPRWDWAEVQPVERAAATVERFLRERPDLR